MPRAKLAVSHGRRLQRPSHGGRLLTSLHARGRIPLDPPGILAGVAAFYAGTDLALAGPDAGA